MRILVLLFCAALSFLPSAGRAQSYSQAELDALLAPVALYPDPVLSQVLDAATAPQEVAQAAQWSRANTGMTADDAVRAVQQYGWRPSVKALVAYPELLARMAESPQWTFDLGNAWVAQQAAVMDTVQALRQRAYASGNLRSDGYQTVQDYGNGIAGNNELPPAQCGVSGPVDGSRLDGGAFSCTVGGTRGFDLGALLAGAALIVAIVVRRRAD